MKSLKSAGLDYRTRRLAAELSDNANSGALVTVGLDSLATWLGIPVSDIIYMLVDLREIGFLDYAMVDPGETCLTYRLAI